MFSDKLVDIYGSIWSKVMTDNINLKDMQELFLCRVSAFKNLASNDIQKREKAREFLLATMTQSEDEYNFPQKEQFVKNVIFWDIPIVTALRSDGALNALVYKINYKVGDQDKTLHEISFFSKNESGEYKFTHKYNLSNLHEQYCSTSPMEQAHIRQLGDQVLHRETETVLDFTEERKRLSAQIQTLKTMLTSTGGVGIASNQCSDITDPLKVTLVGVDYNNPEHVIKAVSRYPNTLFPQMIICVNPMVVDSSTETENFAEGCLSFQGRIRGQVKRPKSLTVRYQDINGLEKTEFFSGSDARVMQHELDHILNGKVYIQRIIEELDHDQCESLIEIITGITSNPTSSNPFLAPFVIFERNKNGDLVLDLEKAKDSLQSLKPEALSRLQDHLRQKMQSRVVNKA